MRARLPENEAERLKWLRQGGILDTPAEDAFDDITRLVSKICTVPMAAVSLIDEERQWFKSVVGLSSRQTHRDIAFCAHTILQSEILVVPDATEDGRFRDNPSVTGDDHLRFYAGAPLVTSDGFALGSLCVIDRVPRQISEQQTVMLEVLARQVVSRIEMRRQIALQEALMAQQQRLISERLQAEEAAVLSEQRLLFAVEGAGIGTWSWDLCGDDLGWSEICKALFGMPPDAQVTRERLYASLHSEDREPTRQAIERALADGTIYDMEYRTVWADGSEHWRAARGRGYYGDDGRLLRFDGTIQDIDGRKAAEASLRDAAERQKSLLRDVLSSVTGGRLRWIETEADLPLLLPISREPIPLTATEGLRALRQVVKDVALDLAFADQRWQDLMTAASEAGMNAVTHGGGRGMAQVSADSRGVVQVRVQDWGTGIVMENLPKAALARGWSSTTSLGHGLVMILQSVDRLWLLTGPGGTTLVMEKDREEPPPAWL